MAETELLFETRLIGAEDVNWDNSGTNKKASFVDGNGTPHDTSLINAGHVPLPSTTRALLDNEENVAAGMEVLANRISDITGGSSSSLSADTTINLDSTLTTSAIQNTIDQQPKNLGGHTLTFLFSEGLDASLSSALVFDGFYNGFLVVDLNEDTVSDAADIGNVFHLHDCFCKVEVKNGAISHTLSDYGIKAERCPCVYLTDIAFTSAGGSDNYAFCGIDSDGIITSCSYQNDKTKLISGIIAGLTDEHNSDNSAHSALFASKAPLVSPTFSGTPTAPTPAASSNGTNIVTTAWIRHMLSSASDGLMQASISQNGYTKLPNGLILQWGWNHLESPPTLATITLPLTFPNTMLCAFSCVSGAQATTDLPVHSRIGHSMNWTKSTFQVLADGGFMWFAIGR